MPHKNNAHPYRRRTRAYRFGLHSERVVQWYLRLKGYSILAHRYKTKAGEIDLIARRGRQLVFVEIKARQRRSEQAGELVSTHQQQRIQRAASIYIAKYPQFASLSLRFDVLIMAPLRWPKHIQHAWQYSQQGVL